MNPKCFFSIHSDETRRDNWRCLRWGDAMKCAAVLFLWSKEASVLNVCVESPPKKNKQTSNFQCEILNQEQFLKLNLVVFLCGKYLKTVECIWSLCCHRKSKNVRWLIFSKRRDVCVENGFKADFKGTVELFSFELWGFSVVTATARLRSVPSWALVWCLIFVIKRHDAVRSECSDQSITLHYVYRYSTIPLMELLFMFTLFSINTVILCISFHLLHFFLHDQRVW